ncbi:MAG: 16S rRNA (guanine(527)-N(7))-methyltransferase RsmG, partial [Oscillospiraceae bacterium]|nr:16S rRNA (guanine(527)-N(7))-methyltransferase RsmG [Oscillospiraceae bacterium]
RHFLDSLAPLAYSPLGTAPPGATLIDVGSGAGFPGLPLKIARPDLAVTLLDASEKRVAFLAETARALGLEAGCVHARAEEYALRNLDVFDFAVSRAVADLRELTELCLPFVRTGGAFLAMKSQSSDDEITAAANAIATLGGALEAVSDYALPDGTPRRIAVIRKQSATPEGYPRKYKKISTKPL